MLVNLPLEMDFREYPSPLHARSCSCTRVVLTTVAEHEAANAARCNSDFAPLKKTTIVIPEVLWAKKRVLVMECMCTIHLELALT